MIKPILNLLIFLPEKIAKYFLDFAPLIVRLVVGYQFMTIGWAKLNNLDLVINNFKDWGIIYPEIMAPFASGLEYIGGLFLILGFLTRISAGGLAVVMIVAIYSVYLGDIETLDDFLDLEEILYLLLFMWLAIYGAGKFSIDYVLSNKCK